MLARTDRPLIGLICRWSAAWNVRAANIEVHRELPTDSWHVDQLHPQHNADFLSSPRVARVSRARAFYVGDHCVTNAVYRVSSRSFRANADRSIAAVRCFQFVPFYPAIFFRPWAWVKQRLIPNLTEIFARIEPAQPGQPTLTERNYFTRITPRFNSGRQEKESGRLSFDWLTGRSERGHYTNV
jgi:hypothetical protein